MPQLMTREELLVKVVNTLMDMLDFTFRDIQDDEGNTLPIKDWPQRALISINDISMRHKPASDNRPYDQTIITRVKYPSKLSVINTMMKFSEFLKSEKESEFIDVAKLPRELREAIYVALSAERKSLELMPMEEEEN